MKKTIKYENKKVLVIGLAKSGKAAARLLRELKANVVINDRNSLEDNPDAVEMMAEGFEVVTGGHPLELLDQGFDLIVKNPGIPYRKVPLLMEAIKRKIPILTEVQLAYDVSEAPFIGITATNLSILKTGKAKAIRFSTLEALCRALECQPGDILEYTSGE